MDIIPVRDYWGELLRSRESAYLGLIYRVPPRLWKQLKDVQTLLKNADPSQLYPQSSTFHVTVKGLGYLEEKLERARYEELMVKLKKIIGEFKPFQLSIKRPRSLPDLCLRQS